MHCSGERARLACWRARPRDRELFPAGQFNAEPGKTKGRFGGAPKVRVGLAVARGTRVLPGLCCAAPRYLRSVLGVAYFPAKHGNLFA